MCAIRRHEAGDTPDISHRALTWCDADLAESLPQDMQGRRFDAIVHAAGRAPGPGVTDEELVRNNVDVMRVLVDFATAQKISRFLYLSSISMHGTVSGGVLNEDTPIVEPSVYGRAKYDAERLLKDAAPDVASITLRLPGVSGAGSRGPWLGKVMATILNGDPVELFNPDSAFNNVVDVDDLCALVTNLLDTPWEGARAYVLGSTDPISVGAMVQGMIDRAGSKSTLNIIERSQPSFVIDFAQAMAELDYRPRSTQQAVDAYVDGEVSAVAP